MFIVHYKPNTLKESKNTKKIAENKKTKWKNEISKFGRIVVINVVQNQILIHPYYGCINPAIHFNHQIKLHVYLLDT